MHSHQLKPILLALILITILALPILTYPLGRDQGEFATIGYGILQGKIPYLELWNPKPPAIFYIYSGVIAILGNTSTAIRSLDLMLFPFTGMALYWIALQLTNRRVALLSMIGFGTFYFTEGFWSLTQNDGIANLPMVLATASTLKAMDKGKTQHRWVLAAGIFCCIAAWFKYPFILLALALALGYCIFCIKERNLRHLWIDVLFFTIGGGDSWIRWPILYGESGRVGGND